MTPDLDLVDWPTDRTLALSGYAAGLRLPLALRNSGAAVRPMGEVSLLNVRRVGGGPPLRLAQAPAGLNLAAGAVTRTQLRLRLDPATPPGRYEGKLQVGDLTRTVAIDVLPEHRLAIGPAPVVVDAGPGATIRFDAAFENRGNVALTIDLAGLYPLGEEVPIAPRPVDAGAATEDRLAALLDTVLGRKSAPVLKPFGTAELRQPGGGQPLAPGEIRTLAVDLELPTKLRSTARYHLFAPLYATDLHIVIITAAKSATPPRAARRSKGAAA